MTWEEVLTALGQDGEWEPPLDLGPLPAELAPRAQAILKRLAEQTRDLETRQAEVSRELAELTRNGSGETPPPHFLDTTA